MSIVKGQMKVRCNKCKEEHIILPEDTDFEDSYGGEERSMGTENGYVWEETIECECGNEIEITCEVWEYPVGVFNNDNVTINGGTLIEKFDYDFQESDDDDF